MITQTCVSLNTKDTTSLGSVIGTNLKGGEVVELRSDLGGGKTTLTRGLAAGFSSVDPVTSPSFTICNIYKCKDGRCVYHFDFYRLPEPGIVASELAEAITDQSSVVVVEWGDIVHNVLPKDRITITIASQSDTQRSIVIQVPDNKKYVLKDIPT